MGIEKPYRAISATVSGCLMKFQKLIRQFLVARRFQNHGGLDDRRIVRRRDFDVSSGVLHRRREREREREDADVGVAGLNELRGLRDIFAEHELTFDLVIDRRVAHRRNRRDPVRRMLRVGDRDLADAGIEQRRKTAA